MPNRLQSRAREQATAIGAAPMRALLQEHAVPDLQKAAAGHSRRADRDASVVRRRSEMGDDASKATKSRPGVAANRPART